MKAVMCTKRKYTYTYASSGIYAVLQFKHIMSNVPFFGRRFNTSHDDDTTAISRKTGNALGRGYLCEAFPNEQWN